VLPSGQKLTLGLLAIITLEVDPFCTYAPFPVLLPFFKFHLEIVFCEGVQHHLQFCLDHLSCVKMAAFQFYLQSGKQTKVGCMGHDSHIFFGKKFCHNATATCSIIKVQGEVFTYFHAVAVKHHSSMRN
jgi:hypothetical protein